MAESEKGTFQERQLAHMQANQKLWDELTTIHAKSSFYDVKAFKRGKSTLSSTELQELGDIKGKSLLHLQCHFGLDSMSLARMGAKVTGVDFSEKAIGLAKKLARASGVPVQFYCANVYDLPDVLNVPFDVVYTSYGALCWLPDLKRWAKVAAQFVKPGGTFYVVDHHPFNNVFLNEKDTEDFAVSYSYFHSSEPVEEQLQGSYADPKATVRNHSRQWTHSLSDILNAILGAGMKLQYVHEFPYTNYAHFPFLEQGPDGLWRVKGKRRMPLMFSIKAIKDTPKTELLARAKGKVRGK